MGKFFTVEFKPDIIAGDVSVHQDAGDKSHVDIGVRTLVFDWTEILIPKGGCMLRSITAIVNAEDGAYSGANSLTDYHLHFAKSFNGVAPTTMGAIGGNQTACFDLKDHHVGSIMLNGDAAGGSVSGTAFHVSYSSHDKEGNGLPMVIDLDVAKGEVGYGKLYVCGTQISARHYNTGVIVNGAITSDTETTITVDGVAATKIFSVGDTVYLHDVDTALGTIQSLTDTTITLNAAIAGGTDLADDDELLNANPMKFTMGFEI